MGSPGWHWLIELLPDGMPDIRGPYTDVAHQTKVAREMMSEGRRIMWLDTVPECPPDVGTITLDPLGREDNRYSLRAPEAHCATPVGTTAASCNGPREP